MGRVRRRPGRPWAEYGVSRGGRGPKVTPSTWDAIIRAGPDGYMCLLSLMVDLFICGLSVMIKLYTLHMLCSAWVFLLGFGSQVLRVAGRAKTESTNHEYGEREATRTCLACPTALVGGLFENGCNNL